MRDGSHTSTPSLTHWNYHTKGECCHGAFQVLENVSWCGSRNLHIQMHWDIILLICARLCWCGAIIEEKSCKLKEPCTSALVRRSYFEVVNPRQTQNDIFEDMAFCSQCHAWQNFDKTSLRWLTHRKLNVILHRGHAEVAPRSLNDTQFSAWDMALWAECHVPKNVLPSLARVNCVSGPQLARGQSPCLRHCCSESHWFNCRETRRMTLRPLAVG